MHARLHRCAASAALLLLLWPASAPAPIPDGEFDLSLGPILNLNSFGDCDSSTELGMDVELCVDVVMEHDGKGRYRGMATLEFSGDIEGILTGPASGLVKKCVADGSSAYGRAGFGFHVDGALEALGSLSGRGDVDFECKGDVQPGGFFAPACTFWVRLCVEGECGSGTSGATLAGFLGADPLLITLDADPIDERKFGGTATDDLGNVYGVKGRYRERTDTSKVIIKGDRGTPSTGAKVVLKEFTDEGAGLAKYKVNGCRGFQELD